MPDVTVTPKYVKPLVGSFVRLHTASTALTVGNVVAPTGTGDYVEKTDASTNENVQGLIGLVVAGGRREPDGSIIADERVTVLWFGPVELGADAALDVAKNYFASDTAGAIADASGTVTRRVGAPLSATCLFWNPGMAPATS